MKNSKRQRFQAVILDMDGLILDSEETYFRAFREAALEYGVGLQEAFFTELFGLEAREVERALQAKLGEAVDRDSFMKVAEKHWRGIVSVSGIPQMPGVGELLDLLRQESVPYALATNSVEPYAGLCLKLAGLEFEFPLRVTRDQVANGKPSPDLFLEAARRLGVSAEECLILEDSHTGLAAAKAAGGFAALVQRSDSLKERFSITADYSFTSLNEVAEWFCPFQGGLELPD